MTELLPRRSNPGGSPGGNGGSGPVVRAFPFAYNTAGLVNGHSVYTPTVGDILLDAWVEITTEWDGTTPTCDIGPFTGGNAYGWFDGILGNNGIDLTYGDGPLDGQPGVGVLVGKTPASLALMCTLDSVKGNLHTAAGTNPVGLPLTPGASVTLQSGIRVPGRFISADPIKVVVSQDGTAGGADPGATQGAGVLYLLTTTPVTS